MTHDAVQNSHREGKGSDIVHISALLPVTLVHQPESGKTEPKAPPA